MWACICSKWDHLNYPHPNSFSSPLPFFFIIINYHVVVFVVVFVLRWVSHLKSSISDSMRKCKLWGWNLNFIPRSASPLNTNTPITTFPIVLSVIFANCSIVPQRFCGVKILALGTIFEVTLITSAKHVGKQKIETNKTHLVVAVLIHPILLQTPLTHSSPCRMVVVDAQTADFFYLELPSFAHRKISAHCSVDFLFLTHGPAAQRECTWPVLV